MEEDKATENKLLLSLLNGIARRDYYNEKEIDASFLQTELYPHLSDEEFQNVLHKMTNIIKTISASDMDFNQLEAFLVSQGRKKDGALTEDQAAVITRFWKNHKSRIHNSLINGSTWNKTLTALNWRVDTKAAEKSHNSSSGSVAIVEMDLEDKLHNRKIPQLVQFEMDEEQLSKVLLSLDQIEQAIVSQK